MAHRRVANNLSGSALREELKREDDVRADRYQALRASRLAAELTDEQCRTLAGKIELCDLANASCGARGRAGRPLFVIVSGALGVVRHPQASRRCRCTRWSP